MMMVKVMMVKVVMMMVKVMMKKVMMMCPGVRLNLLSLQPALRTLTSDYNCLKKQVQDFPSLLEKAISEAKQEVRPGSARPGSARPG